MVRVSTVPRDVEGTLTYLGNKEIWAKINKFSHKYSAHFRVSWPGIEILGYYSRAQVLLIYAKNQSSKISCYSPFKNKLVQ